MNDVKGLSSIEATAYRPLCRRPKFMHKFLQRSSFLANLRQYAILNDWIDFRKCKMTVRQREHSKSIRPKHLEIGLVGAHGVMKKTCRYWQNYLMDVAETASQDIPIAHASEKIIMVSHDAKTKEFFTPDFRPLSKRIIRHISGKKLTYTSRDL